MNTKNNQVYYYYRIKLYNIKYYFYTKAILNTREEILDWAYNKGLIEQEDLLSCKDIHSISLDEIKRLEKIMHYELWKEREACISKGNYTDNVLPKLGIHLD